MSEMACEDDLAQVCQIIAGSTLKDRRDQT